MHEMFLSALARVGDVDVLYVFIACADARTFRRMFENWNCCEMEIEQREQVVIETLQTFIN